MPLFLVFNHCVGESKKKSSRKNKFVEVKKKLQVKKKGCGSEEKVVEVKIIVDRSKYFVAGNVTPLGLCTLTVN